LFNVDWNDLWESFEEASPPGDPVDPVENRELTPDQAAVWLDDNQHPLPRALQGRALFEVSPDQRSGTPVSPVASTPEAPKQWPCGVKTYTSPDGRENYVELDGTRYSAPVELVEVVRILTEGYPATVTYR
jgi:hypothetical protein